MKTFFLRIFLTLFGSVSLSALPTHGVVKHGNVEWHLDGKNLNVKSGKKTLIEWKDFSIKKSEKVFFEQADSLSCVFNRVIEKNSSKILGSLNSNGKIFLINPSGIFIGKQARIDTAGFLASTLDLCDENFLNNEDLFFQTSKKNQSSIINLGMIRCGSSDVFLFAKDVHNFGRIEAKKGTIGLASSSEILLRPEGDERVWIFHTLQGSILNEGNLQALTLEMKNGYNPYLYAIKCSGKTEIYSTESKGGKIFLRAKDGSVEISREITAMDPNKSIEAKIVAEKISLGKQSLIDLKENGRLTLEAENNLIYKGKIFTKGGEVLFSILEGKSFQMRQLDLSKEEGGIFMSKEPIHQRGEINVYGNKKREKIFEMPPTPFKQ